MTVDNSHSHHSLMDAIKQAPQVVSRDRLLFIGGDFCKLQHRYWRTGGIVGETAAEEKAMCAESPTNVGDTSRDLVVGKFQEEVRELFEDWIDVTRRADALPDEDERQ